jgi:uncharacterized SAM-dependent methyltransferase
MQTNNKTTVLDTTGEISKKTIAINWENQFVDYTNYAKEYITHYKRAQQGDEVSLSIYPYMRVKWEELNNSLSTATTENLLTEKQIKKILKIQNKILKNRTE